MRLPLYKAEVGMTAGLHEAGHSVVTGGVEPRIDDARSSGIGQHTEGSRLSKGRLADAARPGEQPGVV
jgi:hypothetical protein